MRPTGTSFSVSESEPGPSGRIMLNARLARRLLEDSSKAASQPLNPPQRWHSFQHPSDSDFEFLINTLFRKAAGQITGSPASTFDFGQFQHSTKFDDLLRLNDTTKRQQSS
ncbi:hypothetical protein E4U59_007743 [Claviceps monticola]|nr:hypothetical protein E4U59_007743 [Claviceps monticola]